MMKIGVGDGNRRFQVVIIHSRQKQLSAAMEAEGITVIAKTGKQAVAAGKTSTQPSCASPSDGPAARSQKSPGSLGRPPLE